MSSITRKAEYTYTLHCLTHYELLTIRHALQEYQEKNKQYAGIEKACIGILDTISPMVECE